MIIHPVQVAYALAIYNPRLRCINLKDLRGPHVWNYFPKSAPSLF